MKFHLLTLLALFSSLALAQRQPNLSDDIICGEGDFCSPEDRARQQQQAAGRQAQAQRDRQDQRRDDQRRRQQNVGQAAEHALSIEDVIRRTGNVDCDPRDEERMNKLRTHCESANSIYQGGSYFWPHCTGQGSICFVENGEPKWKSPSDPTLARCPQNNNARFSHRPSAPSVRQPARTTPSPAPAPTRPRTNSPRPSMDQESQFY